MSTDMPPVASNIPEDDAWFQAYRARNAARGGQALINGLPPEQALGMTAEQMVAQNPVLPAPGVAAVTPAQSDRAMVAAEQIGARVAEQQTDRANAGRERYNQFLMDQGINPNSIGAARLTGSSRDRSLNNPSLASQELAVNESNAENARQGRARIAARRAYQRGDPRMWADTLNSLQVRNNVIGADRSSERRNRFWLDNLMGAYNYRNWLNQRANGFSPENPSENVPKGLETNNGFLRNWLNQRENGLPA